MKGRDDIWLSQSALTWLDEHCNKVLVAVTTATHNPRTGDAKVKTERFTSLESKLCNKFKYKTIYENHKGFKFNLLSYTLKDGTVVYEKAQMEERAKKGPVLFVALALENGDLIPETVWENFNLTFTWLNNY